MKNKILEKVAKLIDLKSLITLSLIITLEILIVKGTNLNNDLFLLFSNTLTMVVTYFFTKKSNNNERSDINE